MFNDAWAVQSQAKPANARVQEEIPDRWEDCIYITVYFKMMLTRDGGAAAAAATFQRKFQIEQIIR